MRLKRKAPNACRRKGLSAKVNVMADGCTVYLTLIDALYQGGICLVVRFLLSRQISQSAEISRI